MKKKTVNEFEKCEKKNNLGGKIFLTVTDLSIPFVLGEEYFLHHHAHFENISKPRLNGYLYTSSWKMNRSCVDSWQVIISNMGIYCRESGDEVRHGTRNSVESIVVDVVVVLFLEKLRWTRPSSWWGCSRPWTTGRAIYGRAASRGHFEHNSTFATPELHASLSPRTPSTSTLSCIRLIIKL